MSSLSTGSSSPSTKAALNAIRLCPPSPQFEIHSQSTSPTLNNDCSPTNLTPESLFKLNSIGAMDENDDLYRGVDFSAHTVLSPSFLANNSSPAPARAESPTPGYVTSQLTSQAVHEPGHVLQGTTLDSVALSLRTPPSPSQTFLSPPTLDFLSPPQAQTNAVSNPSPYNNHPSAGSCAVTDVRDDDGLDGANRGCLANARDPMMTTTLHSPRDQNQMAQETAANQAIRGCPNASSRILSRDSDGNWLHNGATGTLGLSPHDRSSVELDCSLNEEAAQRVRYGIDCKVLQWNDCPDDRDDFFTDPNKIPPKHPRGMGENESCDNIPEKEIAHGDQTENKLIDGQIYFNQDGCGPPNAQDLKMIHESGFWGDAPRVFHIRHGKDGRYQPPTSNDAMRQFVRMCQDNGSTVSHTATWGTRRMSWPGRSESANFEVIVTGNLFKKLSLKVNRACTNIRKRRADQEDDAMSPNQQQQQQQQQQQPPSSDHRRPSKEKDSLAGMSRTLSRSRRHQPIPQINTAIFAIGQNAASIGTAHARSGSISPHPAVSPNGRASFSLPGSLRRRSQAKSSLERDANPASTCCPSLNPADHHHKTASLLSPAQGVSHAGATTPTEHGGQDDDNDDEDYDDDAESPDIKRGEDIVIDDFMPTVQGFKEWILRLNPLLVTSNTHLVDRIAQQQEARFRTLMHLRNKHHHSCLRRNCPSGRLCRPHRPANALESQALAAAIFLPQGDYRLGSGPRASSLPSLSDVPITIDSFPPDIPMPPIKSLPAEFECPLCFQVKKFRKPSDWTKHVHEDVQPFTCTFESCKEPKMFKRKADWVRHESEGHRRVDRWTCDVDDCRHRCYRRDNFCQHLVREHKFPEPRVKTRLAASRSTPNDSTWLKVDSCHSGSQDIAQSEPCRFCHRTFSSWKKLTAHLAKHMQQISLPVVRLVWSQPPPLLDTNVMMGSAAPSESPTHDDGLSPLRSSPGLPDPVLGVVTPEPAGPGDCPSQPNPSRLANIWLSVPDHAHLRPPPLAGTSFATTAPYYGPPSTPSFSEASSGPPNSSHSRITPVFSTASPFTPSAGSTSFAGLSTMPPPYHTPSPTNTPHTQAQVQALALSQALGQAQALVPPAPIQAQLARQQAQMQAQIQAQAAAGLVNSSPNANSFPCIPANGLGLQCSPSQITQLDAIKFPSPRTTLPSQPWTSLPTLGNAGYPMQGHYYHS